MMFATLGPFTIGLSPFTGPTKAHETAKATFAKLNVADGKPVLQDKGDELNVKKLSFFFDETFCDPASELDNLQSAFAARMPMPFVPGDASYTGVQYLIESIEVTFKKTTFYGAITRIEAELSLIEAPVSDLSGLATAIALANAPALLSNAGLNIKIVIA